MRKTSLALAAVLTALVTLVSTSAAQAYPDPTINITEGDTTVAPGEEFTLAGDFGGTDCDPWAAEFEGQTATGSGTTWSVTFTAPTEPGNYPLTIVCTYDDDVELSSSVSTGFAPVAATEVNEITITVVEGDGGDDDGAGDGAAGALPDTGGSNLLLVAGGAALVLLGAGLVVARRRA